MRNSKRKSLTIVIGTVAVLLSFNPTASAADLTPFDAGDAYLQNYVALINQNQKNDFPVRTKTNPDSQNFDLSSGNNDMESAAEKFALQTEYLFSGSGLIVQSAQTHDDHTTVNRNPDGTYQITTSLTTVVESSLPTGTKINPALLKNHMLESTMTDIHSIGFHPQDDMRAPNTKSGSSSATVSDTIIPQDQTEETAVTNFDNENNMASQTPCASPKDCKLSLNVARAIKFASQWTSGKNAGDAKDQLDGSFPYRKDNCANFVSQILYASGMPTTGGNFFNRKDPSVWTWNLTGAEGPSWSWDNASTNYSHMHDYAYFTTTPDGGNIYNSPQFSIIYADWHGDGSLDHEMFVDGNIDNGSNAQYPQMPIVSQKTPNRNAVPLSSEMKRATEENLAPVKWHDIAPDYSKIWLS